MAICSPRTTAPDSDDPDELNWIREGLNHRFPWRFGNQYNPQQFTDSGGSKNVRLPSDFIAIRNRTYPNGPGFPKWPGGFTPW